MRPALQGLPEQLPIAVAIFHASAHPRQSLSLPKKLTSDRDGCAKIKEMELHSQIEIQASAERVWKLLTDLASFDQWNPFIPRASGDIQVGERLRITMQPSGAVAMTFRPTVLKAEPERELRWLGHLLIPGLFDGEHIFIIEPLGTNRTRFSQHETFTGLLVPLFARSLRNDTLRGFEEMNQALKHRAEQAAGLQE